MSEVLDSSLKYLGFVTFVLVYGWNINLRKKNTCRPLQTLFSTATTIMGGLVLEVAHDQISLGFRAPTWKTAALNQCLCPQQNPREQINKLLSINSLGFWNCLFLNYNVIYIDCYISHYKNLLVYLYLASSIIFYI